MKQNKSKIKQPVRCFLSIVVSLAACIFVYLLQVPNPMILLITCMVVFTALFGRLEGALSGLVDIVYAVFFFSENHSFLTFNAVNRYKLLIILIAFVINYAAVSFLQSRNEKMLAEVEKAGEKMNEVNLQLEETNRLLGEAAGKDELTGCKNRYSLRKDFNSLINRKISMIIADIDSFKSCNDHYGHAAGDTVLKVFANGMMELFGKEAVYRYGGDEFIIITETDPEEVSARAEEVNSYVRQHCPVSIKEVPAASFGLVHAWCSSAEDLRKLMHTADAALYEAKHSGRGTCVSKETGLHR